MTHTFMFRIRDRPEKKDYTQEMTGKLKVVRINKTGPSKAGRELLDIGKRQS